MEIVVGKVQGMDNYGIILSRSRTTAMLSLEILAKIVSCRKSRLARLENGDISRPFLVRTRGLVNQLALVLFSSLRDTEQYPSWSMQLVSRALLHSTFRECLNKALFYLYAAQKVTKAVKAKL